MNPRGSYCRHENGCRGRGRRGWRASFPPPLRSCHMAHRRFWNVAFDAGGKPERRVSQPSAGGQGGSCLLVGVASNNCSYAPSGAFPDVLRGPRAEARGYYPRPLRGRGPRMPCISDRGAIWQHFQGSRAWGEGYPGFRLRLHPRLYSRRRFAAEVVCEFPGERDVHVYVTHPWEFAGRDPWGGCYNPIGPMPLARCRRGRETSCEKLPLKSRAAP